MNADILQMNVAAAIRTEIENNQIFGGQAAIIKDGCVYKISEGIANVNTGEGFNDGSFFRLASMTKPITACAVLILRDRTLLDIDAPVSKYFPKISQMKIGQIMPDGSVAEKCAPAREITVKNLLTHSGGFGSGMIGTRLYAAIPKEIRTSLCSMTGYYEDNFFLSYEPDEKSEYSPFAAYDALARIVEMISGTDIESFMRENIFAPLGMKDTTFAPNDEQFSRMVTMHNSVDGVSCPAKDFREVFRGISPKYTAGGAGLASTLSDYINFVMMLMQNGEFDGKRILSKDSVSFMKTPHFTKSSGTDDLSFWGAGLAIAAENHSLPTGALIGHGAYGTHFFIVPEENLAGVYMKNTLIELRGNVDTQRKFERAVLASL